MALIKLGVCIIFFAFGLIFNQNKRDTFFFLLVFWFSLFYLVTFPRAIYTACH
jgi:amino acid transporter